MAEAISERNLVQLPIHKPLKPVQSPKKSDWLYVCIQGVPPWPDEYDYITFPGQVLKWRCNCTYDNVSDEELKVMKTDWKTQADSIHQLILSANNDKPIVFTYHSFGTFFWIAYLHFYPQIIKRTVGIIDLGGAPIRFYPLLKETLTIYDQITMEDFDENLDTFYELSQARLKKLNMHRDGSKYKYYAYTKMFIEN